MKSIIIAIVMFLFLILIHEFGHFIIAKKSGIKVNEFAVGMGPNIISKQKGETKYSLNLLPIGGYCAMEGEDDSSDDPRSFNNVKASKRFFTVLAGPFVNLIFAAIVFAIVILNVGVSTTTIGNFSDESAASKAGLKVEDEIVSIAGEKIDSFEEISQVLRNYYKDEDESSKVEVVVERNNEKYIYDINPTFENSTPLLGITSKLEKVNPLKALGLGIREVYVNIVNILFTLKALFTGVIGLNALSGPVGVVKELGNQARLGINNLLYFFAYISVNLGFFNLLPIPALDGSKILTSLYEMITKKSVNKKIEQRATIVGFVLLLALILLVTIKDIFTLVL